MTFYIVGAIVAILLMVYLVKPIEYRLLTVLIEHAGKVLTHQLLLKEVWGPDYVERAHYLRIYMDTLRHKLEKDPARPRFLLAEAGVGYRLAVI